MFYVITSIISLSRQVRKPQVIYGYRSSLDDVERLFCAVLGYLDTEVSRAQKVRCDALNFAAEEQGDFGRRFVIRQTSTVWRLFEGGDDVSFTSQLLHNDLAVAGISPQDSMLGTKSGLVYLPIDFLREVGQTRVVGRERVRGITCQIDSSDAEAVGRPKQRANIVRAADVVSDNDNVSGHVRYIL